MDAVDMKENYFKALEAIKDLRKKNNNLQDTVKKLKTRSRWPEHVKAAVCSKEMSENQKEMETRLLELSSKCCAYEREINFLKTNSKVKNEEPKQQNLPARSEERNGQIKDDRADAAEAKVLTLQTTLQRNKQLWTELEAAYKQQLEEAGSRLQQIEDRLTQVLRLRNMDSAELIRMCRAVKVKTAENTTLQDEIHRSKVVAEESKARLDEIMNKLTREQQKKSDLQDELAQAQLAQQSLCDVTQELEEVKKEREMLRGHLKTVLAETSKVEALPSKQESPTTHLKLQQEVLTNQKRAAQFEEQFKSEVRFREQLEGRLKDVTAENHELKKKLKDAKNHQQVVAGTDISLGEKKSMVDQGVQTINLNMDFKPPDVSCVMSGEESDQALATIYAEFETSQKLLHAQTHITKLYKLELDSLHEQIQTERTQSASNLATMMTKIRDLQDQKFAIQEVATQQDIVNQQIEKELVTERPKPAPRRSKLSVVTTEETPAKYSPKGMEIKIHYLNASEGSPLLDDDGACIKLFVEFGLKGAIEESFETNGNFPRPPTHDIPIFINQSHRLEDVSNSSQLFFSIVGEPEDNNEEDNNEDSAVDCIDFGTAELQLDSLRERLRVDHVEFKLPILSEECLIGHLTVSARSTA